jgi:tetratricopeptide (TPR) repeat protein
MMVGLLAAGKTRAVKERLDSEPEEKLDENFKRLAAVRDLTVGSFARVRERLKDEKANCANSLLLSLAMLGDGETEEARKRLNAVEPLDHSPDRREAVWLSTQLFYGAAMNFEAGLRKEARSSLREAESLAGRIALPWQRRAIAYHHAIAEDAALAGDMSLAVESWRRALELAPENKAASLNLDAALSINAAAEWRAGRAQQAVELWKECLKSRPGNERLLKNAAIGCEKIGRKEEAADYWRALARVWRQQVAGRQADEQLKDRLTRLEDHLVNLMVESGKPIHEILAELKSALKLDPSNMALRKKCADIFLELDNPQQALKQLEQIERKHGESAELLLHKGMALDMMRRRAAARKCFERAFDLEPSNPAARRIFLSMLGDEAVTAEREDDLDRAIEICQRQLSIDPEYIPAVFHLATLHFDCDEEEEANQVIGRLIAIDPQDAKKRFVAGHIYLENGCKKEAESEFQKALEIKNDPESLVRIGEIYLECGEDKKAMGYFKRASKDAPISLLLDMSKMLYGGKHSREAEHYVDMAMRKDPNHPEPHLGKGIILLGQRKMEEGERELEEATRLATGRSEFAYVLEAVDDVREDLRRVSEISRLLKGLEGKLPLDVDSLPPDLRRMLAEVLEDL